MMELEELIKTLEGAQELATEGEWRVMPAGTDALGADTYDIEAFGLGTTDRPLATGVWSQDARSIAIGHNTGAEVLRYLERARQTEREWDRRSSTLHECIADQRTRAEKAEAEVERLRNINRYGRSSGKDPTP